MESVNNQEMITFAHNHAMVHQIIKDKIDFKHR